MQVCELALPSEFHTGAYLIYGNSPAVILSYIEPTHGKLPAVSLVHIQRRSHSPKHYMDREQNYLEKRAYE
jgi:hypothetical protein